MFRGPGLAHRGPTLGCSRRATPPWAHSDSGLEASGPVGSAQTPSWGRPPVITWLRITIGVPT